MATFQIEMPGGEVFEVTANSEQEAMAALRRMMGAAPAEPQERGMLGKAADWLTGANRDPEIPGALSAGLGLSPEQSAQMTALLSTTVSDERMQRGIMEIEPQARFDKDENGALVAVMPDGTRFYPNPPGLDLTDAMIGTGAASLATGIGGIARGIGLGSGMLAGAATGATEAALIEGASSQLTDSDYKLGDIPSGAAFGAAGNKMAQVVTGLVRRFRTAGAPSVLDPATGELRPDVAAQLQRMGLDPATVRAEFAQAVIRDVRGGIAPEAAAQRGAAGSLPVPVPLSRGQATGSKGQQLFEDGAASGAYGRPAEAMFTGFRAQQEAALRANMDTMLRDLAPGAAPVARNEGAAAAQRELVNQRDAATARANSLYDAARASGSAAPDPNAALGLASQLRRTYSAGFSPRTAPTVGAMLDDLDAMVQQGAGVRELMEWRAQVTGLNRGTPTVDAAAASDVVRAFDEGMKDLVDQQLLAGDAAAVARWHEAIGNYAEFAKLWKSKGGILSTLTDTTLRDGETVLKVAPEAAGNVIFTATASGLANRVGLARDLVTLRKQLPKEQWDALRQEAFIRLVDTSRGAVRNGEQGVSGVNFLRAWNDLREKNAGVVNALFTKEEQKLFTQFGSVAARATGGAVNSSNSANAMGGMIQRIAGAFGGTSLAQFLMRVPLANAATSAIGAGRAYSAIGGRVAPQPPLPAGLAAGVAGAAGGSAAGTQQADERLRQMLGFPN